MAPAAVVILTRAARFQYACHQARWVAALYPADAEHDAAAQTMLPVLLRRASSGPRLRTPMLKVKLWQGC